MRARRTTLSGVALLLACVTGLAGLAACGSEDAAPVATDSSATDTPSDSSDDGGEPTSSDSADDSATAEPTDEVPEDAPACADVWADGSKLSRFYRGCVDEDGTYVERDALGCSSGQRLVRFADRFYGVVGGTIHEASSVLNEDRQYVAAERRCTA